MSRGQRLLDESWTRVDHFDPAKPSPLSKPNDAMQVDEDRRGEEGSEMSESEWEYEETEELVTLDLGPESKRLFQMSHQYSITGLETDRPFFRLGNVFFKGHWDQLIGTEIILRDEKDSSSSRLVASQHEFQPLPATETDKRLGRAPSTTRHRIQFRPAANMAARQEALQDPGNPSNVNLVSHKGGWVWIRGRGWIRKDQRDWVDDGEEVYSVPVDAARPSSPPKKKMGRKKMTDEEKLRLSIWKSLQKIDNLKKKGAGGEESGGHGEDETIVESEEDEASHSGTPEDEEVEDAN